MAGISAVQLAAYCLLRSAEPARELSDAEVERLWSLLDDRDSLGCFALCSADPLG